MASGGKRFRPKLVAGTPIPADELRLAEVHSDRRMRERMAPWVGGIVGALVLSFTAYAMVTHDTRILVPLLRTTVGCATLIVSWVFIRRHNQNKRE